MLLPVPESHTRTPAGEAAMSHRLELTSRTDHVAPGTPLRGRLQIGVGEYVHITANQPVRWTIPGMLPSTTLTTHTVVQFLSAGPQVVMARAPNGQQASLIFTVVMPSISVTKLGDMTLPLAITNQNGLGAYMQLQFTFTPLTVSFEGLEFRELDCPVINPWGYYTSNAPPRHTATAGWTPIDPFNQLQDADNASIFIIPANMTYPLTAGGYEWSIPGRIRIATPSGATTELPLAAPMTETARFDPAPGLVKPQFRGSLTVWKGGCMSTKSYP
jgi:hypothetical protein